MESANTTTVCDRQRRKVKMSNERSEQQMIDVFEVDTTLLDSIDPTTLIVLEDSPPKKEPESNTGHPCDEEED